mmetsp:Transcript_35492/g.54560  ORF Transcript_35492/g.54560 Transcript_35492/m.54560 type:complete len:286 (+) Transcript_35492:87-944(+)
MAANFVNSSTHKVPESPNSEHNSESGKLPLSQLMARAPEEPEAEPIPDASKRKKRGRPAGLPKKPKDYPRRPLSAYNIFFKRERTRLVQETEGKIHFETIAKIIGQKWKAITKKELKELTFEAQRDLGRYRQEICHYEARQRKAAEKDLRKQFAEADRVYRLQQGHPVLNHPDSNTTAGPGVARVECRDWKDSEEGRGKTMINGDRARDPRRSEASPESEDEDMNLDDVFGDEDEDEAKQVQKARIKELDEEIHVRTRRVWALSELNDDDLAGLGSLRASGTKWS